MVADKEKKEKKRNEKRCRTCSLDCSVIRVVALDKIPDAEKKEKAISMFGSEKPAYTPGNCPKR